MAQLKKLSSKNIEDNFLEKEEKKPEEKKLEEKKLEEKKPKKEKTIEEKKLKKNEKPLSINSTEKENVSFSVELKISKTINQYSRLTGVTRSTIITEALQEYIKKHSITKQIKDLLTAELDDL